MLYLISKKYARNGEHKVPRASPLIKFAIFNLLLRG